MGEIENVLVTDLELFYECKKIVLDIVETFGKEYYLDKDYLSFMKSMNK